MDVTEPELRILCVCTGNIYRSRLAQDALRRGLHERLGSAAAGVTVLSAGTHATSGRPLPPAWRHDLEQLAVDPQTLGATRRLEAADIASADLVLCADHQHRAAVLALVPGAWRRTFLLGELARTASRAAELAGISDLVGPDEAPARIRSVLAAATRYRGTVAPGAPPDGIADPAGGAWPVLELAARQVRDAVDRALDGLVGGGSGDGAGVRGGGADGGGTG